jgi:hypothetical protein
MVLSDFAHFDRFGIIQKCAAPHTVLPLMDNGDRGLNVWAGFVLASGLFGFLHYIVLDFFDFVAQFILGLFTLLEAFFELGKTPAYAAGNLWKSFAKYQHSNNKYDQPFPALWQSEG